MISYLLISQGDSFTVTDPHLGIYLHGILKYHAALIHHP